MQPSPTPDPVSGTSQPCPICGAPLPANPRYPRYLCPACASQSCDESGRPLRFLNTGPGGGFEAVYADSGEPRDSHACFVRGFPCHADEARFGGIVIQTLPPQDSRQSPNP